MSRGNALSAIDVKQTHIGNQLPVGGLRCFEHIAGQKSLAISVMVQPQDKTLTDADIETISQKIIAEVQKKTGGTLRL